MAANKIRPISISLETLEKRGEKKTAPGGRDFYRLDSRERRILVIGSGQPRSVASVGWLDPWPALADFDVVILNLAGLDRFTLIRLSNIDKERLSRMRSEIFDLLLSNGEVYCLLSPFLAFGSTVYGPDGSAEPEWSNYQWSPLGFSTTEIRGESVLLEEGAKFEEYLRQVTRWDCYLNPSANVSYLEERLGREGQVGADEEVFWQSLPLALNRYGKAVAASLCFGVRQRDAREDACTKIRWVSDFIHLLPIPNRVTVEQGIDLLIEEARGLPARSLSPEWVQLYRVPGEKNLEQKLGETLRRIQAAEREQKQLFQMHRDLQRCKGLLFEHGENLKRILAEVFRRLGYAVRSYAPGTELLVVETRQGKLIVDAAGRSGPAQAEDLQLLLKYAIYAQEDDGRIWKGLLVFSHYRLDDPTQPRPPAFPPDVLRTAREMHLGLATAEGMFAAFCAIRQGSMLVEELTDRLLKTTGALELPSAEPESVQPSLHLTLPELKLEF